MTVDFIDGGIPRLNLYASFIGQIKHFLKACTNRFVAIGLSEVSEKGNFSAIDMAIPSQKSGYYTVQVKADDVDYCSLRLCAEAIYGADSKNIEDVLLDPDGYGIGDESLYSPNIVVVNAVADNLTDATCEKFILNTAKDAFEPYRTEYFIIAVNSNTKKDIKNMRMFYVNGETGKRKGLKSPRSLYFMDSNSIIRTKGKRRNVVSGRSGKAFRLGSALQIHTKRR